METEAVARTRGKELLSKMNGKGWTLRVWNNIGWHYCLENKNGLSVSPSGVKGTYFASLSEDGCGDLGIWHPHPRTKTFNDPNKAVLYKLKTARKVVDELNDLVTQAENDMGQDPS